jgi:polyphenol oxidase
VEAFEVGIEVAEQFSTAFDDERVVRRTGERPHVDLRRAIALQLRAQGLDDSSIDVSDLCTFARPDLFFSHRRDAGVTGRMCAMICPRRET